MQLCSGVYRAREAEHSIEMQLPFLAEILNSPLNGGSPAMLVPLLVGQVSQGIGAMRADASYATTRRASTASASDLFVLFTLQPYPYSAAQLAFHPDVVRDSAGAGSGFCAFLGWCVCVCALNPLALNSMWRPHRGGAFAVALQRLSQLASPLKVCCDRRQVVSL